VKLLSAFKAVSPIPFTVKCRTGIQLNKNVTHGLLPLFNASGASLITLHGRCQVQRYTKLANWEYIRDCASQSSGEAQFFGNGDVLSWEDYYRDLETGVDGVMIGRGALIKPWIFQEIKERRTIDISSSERLELLKKFANYGLEYWGSDNIGLDHTRRYLLEWLSFTYRYIPVGLLEVLPQGMNDKPPLYKGRDDLETLMASNNAADWIKLTEMVLGPTPESFSFVPK
jgi:tRNA-dihydrouridine synthase 3